VDDDDPLIGCQRVRIDPCQQADQIALHCATEQAWVKKVNLNHASPSGAALDEPGGHCTGA